MRPSITKKFLALRHHGDALRGYWGNQLRCVFPMSSLVAEDSTKAAVRS